jgi:hypothetical protein
MRRHILLSEILTSSLTFWYKINGLISRWAARNYETANREHTEKLLKGID